MPRASESPRVHVPLAPSAQAAGVEVKRSLSDKLRGIFAALIVPTCAANAQLLRPFSGTRGLGTSGPAGSGGKSALSFAGDDGVFGVEGAGDAAVMGVDGEGDGACLREDDLFELPSAGSCGSEDFR